MLSTFLLLKDDPRVKKALKIYVLREIKTLNKQRSVNLSLCYGLTGIAYSLMLALKVLPELNSFMTEFNSLYTELTREQIDQTSRAIKKRGVRESDYDLIQGLSSCLEYLGQYGVLSSGDQENQKRIVQLFDWLFKSSDYGLPNGLIKNNNIIDEDRKRYFTKGYVNLGLSHGFAGPLAALSTIPNTQALGTVLNFYEKLFYQNRQANTPWTSEVSFQNLIQNDFKVLGGERASWCYGNPGIARAVFEGAKLQNNQLLMETAVNYFLSLKSLDFDDLQLKSPTICHGISGLLLILNAMERDTGLREIGLIKQRILARLLSVADFEKKLVFMEYDMVFRGKRYDTPGYFNDIGLLNGSGGIVLTLMSLQSKQRLDWERILLVS